MTVIMICDRCGDVTVASDLCRCTKPYDAVEIRRRHRAAVARARVSSSKRSARKHDRPSAA